MLKVMNLKENNATVDYALALVEIEIEASKIEGIIALKVLHGYGSHGKGGAIKIELGNKLKQWKKNGFIVDYFGGDEWSIFNPKTMRILELDKSIYIDEDMEKANPGITIIQVTK